MTLHLIASNKKFDLLSKLILQQVVKIDRYVLMDTFYPCFQKCLDSCCSWVKMASSRDTNMDGSGNQVEVIFYSIYTSTHIYNNSQIQNLINITTHRHKKLYRKLPSHGHWTYQFINTTNYLGNNNHGHWTYQFIDTTTHSHNNW